MIILLFDPSPLVNSPGKMPQVSSMTMPVEGLPPDLREALKDHPHAIEIPPPSDPLIRSLMDPKARRFFVCYTPNPVYFCQRGIQYRIETTVGVHYADTLPEVWDLAKAL